MDLSSVNKHTSRNLAISAVFFSGFGGMTGSYARFPRLM